MRLTALVVSIALICAPLHAQPGNDGLIGLTRAVIAAERYLSARAIEAELETRSGRLVYEVDLVRRGTLHRITVDARSGRLVSTERPRIENWIRSWFDADKLHHGDGASPLGTRLRALEKQSGGKVHEVEFTVRENRAFYDIELATGAGVGEVRIDARTGERVDLAYED